MFLGKEEWLVAAMDKARPVFAKQGLYVSGETHVTVGHMSLDNPEQLMACILSGLTPDDVLCGQTGWRAEGAPQIVISPNSGTATETLATLVHEMIHAALPFEVGHGSYFQRHMAPMGLGGAPGATTVGSNFMEVWGAVLAELGPMPGDTGTSMSTRLSNLMARGRA